MKTIALLSGGLDSTVLVAHLLAQGDEVQTLSVDYGQRHRIELDAALAVAGHYGLQHDVIDLSAVGAMLTGSALTDPGVDVPEGHYADESMRSTVVPNRNAIMIMCAVGIASARGFNRVTTAVHAGDHPVYPDCRPDFIGAVSHAAQLATRGFGDVAVDAPFVRMDKVWIAGYGTSLEAPLHLTWSCYKGDPYPVLGDGAKHCGRCGTCVERREAFQHAGVTDPTAYYDEPVNA